MKARSNKQELRAFFQKDVFSKNRFSIWSLLPEFFLVLILALFLTVTTLFFANHKYYEINQGSMRPLFNNYEDANVKDGVFVLLNSEAEVGDIVVIEYGSASIIKRLIAVGGDRVSIVKKQVAGREEYFVQRIPKGQSVGYLLEEPYVVNKNGMKSAYEKFQKCLQRKDSSGQLEFEQEEVDGVVYLVVQEDEIFYLGDNRGSSHDSSSYGPTKKEGMVGRVVIIAWKEQNILFHILQYAFGFKKV